MKKIVLKKIELLNFKGIAQASFEFNPQETSVLGANGTGKTTIFDAFTWCLFGKDSLGVKEFGLKTLSESGDVIPRLVHEVKVTLMVDGNEVSLRKASREKWVKTRGEAEEHFEGNEELRFFNDVPCSVNEWNQKIGEIATFDAFRLLTSPTYFSSMRPIDQKNLLVEMAAVTDADTAATNADFAELVSNLGDKAMNDYKKEIAAKIERIKTEMKSIPYSISEVRRMMPQSQDFSALENELNEKREALAKVDAQLAMSASTRDDAKRLKLNKKLAEYRSEKTRVEFTIKNRAEAEYQKALSECTIRKNNIKSLELIIAQKTELLNRLNASLSIIQEDVAACASKREELLAEFRSIKSRQLEITDDCFVCPTCHRRYDLSEIETKENEIKARFNTQRAQDLEDNKRRGLENNKKRMLLEAKLDQARTQIIMIQNEIKADTEKLETLKADIRGNEPTRPDIDDMVKSDAEYKKLYKLISKLEKELDDLNDGGDEDLSELKEAKDVLTENIESLIKKLEQEEFLTKSLKRIAELQHQLKRQAEQVAELERTEFLLLEFSKAKASLIEQRIQSMFKLVRFKMFRSQINGAVVEHCEAMVDGVPYSSLNSAMKINAGLDIINALCRHYDTYAPIFVDNAESVNELIPTDSQLIRLVVTDDAKITIQ